VLGANGNVTTEFIGWAMETLEGKKRCQEPFPVPEKVPDTFFPPAVTGTSARGK
jgi:hypothetical protein